MCLNMSLQLVRPVELLGATHMHFEGTFELFHSLVRQLMPTQLIPPVECCLALIASEWLLTCVHHTVHLQVSRSLELFITKCADMLNRRMGI